jgi:hypothetical protein
VPIIPSNSYDRCFDAAPASMLPSHAGPVSDLTPLTRPALVKIAAGFAALVRKHARFAIITTGCALYLLPFMRVMLPRTDEGIFLSGAARLVHGQMFGRDFREVMGPATFYWLALFYRVFGISFLAAHLCLFVSWTATVMVIYRLSRYVSASYRLLPLLLILETSLLSLGMGISHHINSNCLALLAVLCLDTWHQKRRALWLVLAGALAALTVLVHQHKGMLLLLAALAWVWMVERKKPTTVRALATVTAGFAGIIGLSAAFFATQGALADVIGANYVWPFQHYSAINNVPYGWGTFTYNWRGLPLSTPGTYGIFLFACVLIVPFLFVDILPGLLVLQAWRRGLRSMPADIRLYLLCGVLLWISELHRKDITHLVFGSPLLIIVSVQLFSQSRRKLSRFMLVLLTGSASALAICNLLLVLTAHPVPPGWAK